MTTETSAVIYKDIAGFPGYRVGDGRLANLCWGTPEANRDDIVRHGGYQAGEAHPMRKLTADQVAEIRRRYAAGGVLQRELAEQFGVSVPNISTIVNGGSWATQG